MIIPLQDGIDEAKKSHSIYKHSCILFTPTTVLAKGYNSTMYHAEAVAAKRLKNNRGCYALVISVGKSGKLRSSKPCKHCTEILRNIKVKGIYYSDRDGNLNFVRPNKLTDTKISSGHNIRYKKESYNRDKILKTN